MEAKDDVFTRYSEYKVVLRSTPYSENTEYMVYKLDVYDCLPLTEKCWILSFVLLLLTKTVAKSSN
jgi:hypothetical protein